MNFFNGIKNNATTLLTAGACVGIVATTALAIKNTMDAYEDIKDYKIYKTEESSILKIAKHYIPTGIAMVCSIGFCVGSNVVHTKQNDAAIASLMSTLSALVIAKDGKNEIEYKKTEEIYADNYMNPPYELEDDDFIWVFEDFRNNQHDSWAGWFRVKRIDLERAEYDINRLFILRGDAKLTEFYDYIRMEAENSGYHMDESFGKYFSNSDQACDLMWSEYFEADDGYQWIDFYEQEIYGPGGKLKYIILSYPFEPKIDPSDFEYPQDDETLIEY